MTHSKKAANQTLRTAIAAVLAASAIAVVPERAEAGPDACTEVVASAYCFGNQSAGIRYGGIYEFQDSYLWAGDKDYVEVLRLSLNRNITPAAGTPGMDLYNSLTTPLTLKMSDNRYSIITQGDNTPGMLLQNIGLNAGNVAMGNATLVNNAVNTTTNGRNSNAVIAESGVNVMYWNFGGHQTNWGMGGDVNVTTTGSIFTNSRAADAASNGIYAHSFSIYSAIGHTVTVNSTSPNIHTYGGRSNGIFGLSEGGFGEHGDSGAGGDSGSPGGNGGDVRILGGGTIITEGVNAHGILAISRGGRGGNGGNGVIGNAGNGVFGGRAGGVQVEGAWDIGTLRDHSYGIFAESLGGSGGTGGTGYTFGDGGTGGGSGDGYTVRVVNSGNIETYGAKSTGIFAHSVGGFAGSGGSSYGVVGYGGSGESAGHGGIVFVRNTGLISTSGVGADGILAQSVGGGGGAGGNGGGIVALGGQGASGGNGNSVTVVNQGNITATRSASRGIFAQSVGGGGGDGGNSGGVAAIGGGGGSTSNGGTVSVNNLANVSSAAHAIFAESVGGGGGNGGSSTGWFSVGGGAGAGGDAQWVYVNNTGTLRTTENNSSAIFAHSIGGGGGNGGNSVAAGAFGSVAIGGSGAHGGDGAAVTVVNSATGTINTGNTTGAIHGDGSHGIFAQSIGGGGGNGGYAFAGAVGVGGAIAIGIGGSADEGGDGKKVIVDNGSSITTRGNDAHAIFAESVGGGGGNGGFSIAVSGADTVSAAVSVGGKGAGGGSAETVNVTTTGQDLNTYGARSYGVLAQSVGGGGGNGGFSIAGTFAASGVGAAFSLGGSGDSGGIARNVTVESSSNIMTRGVDAHGLFAQSLGGGGGSGGFSVAGTISGGAAVDVSLGGSGAGGGIAGQVLVGQTNATTGTIHTVGKGSYGLLAQSVGGGGGSGGFSVGVGISASASAQFSMGGHAGAGSDGNIVNVRTANNVMTEGDDSHGIFVQSVGGGGGNGGFSVAGSISVNSGAVGASLGGGGAGGGNANDVTVESSGANIYTRGDRSYGLLAQSVGGGGGDGGFSVAGSVTSGPAANFSMGGNGDVGGQGRNVAVHSSSSITTLGQDSHGLFAQSLGGGGGSGGFSVTGSISANSGSVGASIGGSGKGGGNAGTVYLGRAINGVAAPLTGTISTGGDRAYGILAQSVGGGGGDGGFSVAGGITKGPGVRFSMGGNGDLGGAGNVVIVDTENTIATHGAEAHGIFAQSLGGGGGSGGFSVASSISQDSGSLNASIGGSGKAGGDANDVTVNSHGDSITTEGLRSYGILAQSVGGGGGDGGFSVAGSITKKQSVNFSLGGFGDVGGDSRTVAIANTTNITTHGDESHALFAQSLGGGGGNGGFSVTGSIFTDNSNNKPSVNISIGGFGGGGGEAGAVNIGADDMFVGGTLSTFGNNAHGIFAQSVGGGGGNGGFSIAGGFSKSPTATFSVGGFAGTASNGDVVNVYTASAITTRGSDAHGVFAQSIGGGGGNGGFSVAGSATTAVTDLNASVGGKGGGGGYGDVVTVMNSGSIATLGERSFGVLAQSVGGGGGNGGFAVAGSLSLAPTGTPTAKGPKNINFAVGGFGGNGDAGGAVTVVNDGAIDTFGIGAHGILAHSVGGGGGDGGFAGAGSLGVVTGNTQGTRASIAVSVGGFGGEGNVSGEVTVDNHQAIVTRGHDARGIYAYSVGGGGGDGGASYAINTALGKPNEGNGLNVEISVGGFGGDGNESADVFVTNTGSIETLGVRADAIYAQSIGGGGGDGGNAQAVSLDFSRDGFGEPKTKPGKEWNFVTAVGGFAGHANHGHAVTVTNDGSIVTHGVYSRGIVAQSVGGGGGNGGAGINGTGQPEFDEVTGLLDLKDKNILDVRNWSALVGGAGGASGNGGEIHVTNHGAITTFDLGSTAIFAQSIGGGGGEAQNFATGTGKGGTAGIGVNSRFGIGGAGGASGNGDLVTVINTGRIETQGDDAHGIFAQSIGGGGGVAGNVDRGLAAGLGPIPPLNIGVGLAFGQAGGGGGNSGAVTVTNSHDILTLGDGAFGIFAQSVAGGGGVAGGLGNTSGTPLDPVFTLQNFAGSVGGSGSAGIVAVTQTGNITALGNLTDAVFAQSSAGQGTGAAVTVNLTGHIDAGGADSNGILAQSHGDLGSGNVAVTINSGSVRGGTATGAAISIADGLNNTVTNRGAIGRSSEITRMAIRGTSGNETVANFGGIAGNVDLGAGINAFVNQIGATLLSGTTLNVGAGGVFTNHSTWSIGNANAIATTTMTGNLRQTSTGQLFVDLDHTSGTADRVTVLDNGTAALAGTLELNHLNLLDVKPGMQHIVLVSASGGVDVTGLTLNTGPSLVTQYRLTQRAASQLALDVTTDFSLAANGITLSPNQAAIGRYVNSVQAANGSPGFTPVVAHLLSLDKVADIAATYERLNPDAYATATAGTIANTLQFGDALLSCKVRDGDYHFTTETQCGWFGVTFNRQTQDATNEANGFERDGSVLAGGVQFAINAHWHVGFGAAYNADRTAAKRMTSDLSQSSGSAVQQGIVIKGNYGNTTVAGSIAGSHGEYDSTRLAFNGALASGEQSVTSKSVQLRVAHAIDLRRWYWRPMLDVNYADVHHSGFDETGAGGYNLHVLQGDETFASLQPQLEAGYDLPHNGGVARLYARLGLTHYLKGSSVDVSASMANAPSGATAFTVSQSLDRNLGDVAVGVDLFSANGVVMRLGYTGQYSSHSVSHGGALKLSLPF